MARNTKSHFSKSAGGTRTVLHESAKLEQRNVKDKDGNVTAHKVTVQVRTGGTLAMGRNAQKAGHKNAVQQLMAAGMTRSVAERAVRGTIKQARQKQAAKPIEPAEEQPDVAALLEEGKQIVRGIRQ